MPHFALSAAKFAGVFLAVVSVSWFISGRPTNLWIGAYLSLIWSIYLPLAVIGFLGSLRSGRLRPSTFTGRARQRVIFLVPTVCRDDTAPALRRVVDSVLDYAPANLDDFRVDIVIDEGAEAELAVRRIYQREPRVRFVVVPRSYATPNGTRFKARANQYACDLRTSEGENTADIFVYHLDDDTSVGPDTVASIAEFIHHDNGTYHVAQGVLTFPHELSPSFLCRLADSVRPADDLTRFQFFTGRLGQPLGGLHGEHLLIRASIEEEIGWDFGPRVKVEDAYFAIFFAARYPRRSTFLASCTYGASPATVRDLVKQRQRWAAGLIGLVADPRIPLRAKAPLGYSVLTWMSAPFQHVAIVIPAVVLTTGVVSTSPLVAPLLVVWSLNFAYQLWMYLEGLRINLAVSRRRHLGYVRLSTILVGCFFVLSAIEGWAATRGAIDFLRGKSSFEVITKRR